MPPKDPTLLGAGLLFVGLLLVTEAAHSSGSQSKMRSISSAAHTACSLLDPTGSLLDHEEKSMR